MNLREIFRELKDKYNYVPYGGPGHPTAKENVPHFVGKKKGLIRLQRDLELGLCVGVYLANAPSKTRLGGLEVAIDKHFRVPVQENPIGPSYFVTFTSMDKNEYAPYGNDPDERPFYWHEEIARYAPRRANAFFLGDKVGELIDSANRLGLYFRGFNQVKLHFYDIGYYDISNTISTIRKEYKKYKPQFPNPESFGIPLSLPR